MWPVWAELQLFGRPLLFTGYGLFAILGVAAGIVITLRAATRAGFPAFDAFAAAILGVVAGFIGAKLLFLLVSWRELAAEGASFLLAQGGLVFYGGVIGGVLGAVTYLRAYQLDPLRFADLAAPGLAVGHAFGRVGCVMAGCCYGKPSTLPWAFAYPETPYFKGVAHLPLHPVQLYEATAELLIAAICWRFGPRLARGRTFALWLALYSAVRVFLELFVRGDDRGATLLGLAPSAALGLLGLGCALVVLLRGPRFVDNTGQS